MDADITVPQIIWPPSPENDQVSPADKVSLPSSTYAYWFSLHINITKVGGLEDIESQITLIKQQQDANQKKIDSLNFQITGNK